jgi:SAM-dependent methyltransferase
MNPNAASRGDCNRLAQSMREGGEDIVRRAGIAPGMKVLDLGCGNAITAIPAAKLGASVLGVAGTARGADAANRLAAQAGLAASCHFLEGDAADLRGVENKSFDRVVSVFGAMFAPRPFDVAREMVRVTRPGGRIVMGNWIGQEPTLMARLLDICASYAPPQDGQASPVAWGSPQHVIERFGAAGIAWEGIAYERDSFVFDFDGSPAEFAETFRQCHAPTMNAFDAAARDGRAQALRCELEALFESQNLCQYPGRTLISATYLQVTVEVA